MAFPTATTATSQQSTNSATRTVTLPVGVAAGDLVIALIAGDGTTTFTWPSPWVEIKDEAGSGFVFTAAYLIASGGETSVAVTASAVERSNHIALRITGWHGTTPPEIAAAATGSSTTPNPPSLTPSWGAADTLWIAIAAADDSATPFPITAWPANYTTNQIANATATSAADVALATRGLNAAAEDPGTFTMTGTETWNAYTIAVRPAAETAISGTDSGAASDTASAPAVALTSIDSGAGIEAAASLGNVTATLARRVTHIRAPSRWLIGIDTMGR